MPLSPFNDDLGNRFLTGGKNPKRPDRRPRRHEPKDPPMTIVEIDESFWRIREIYGRQDDEGPIERT